MPRLAYLFPSGECVKAEASVPTKFLLNDKDQQVHVVGCTPAATSAVYTIVCGDAAKSNQGNDLWGVRAGNWVTWLG